MSVASCSAALVAPAARITAARRSSSMSTAFVALRAPQQHGSVARGALQQRARRAASIVAQAAPTDTGAGKLISKVEIPAFIPRYDLIDQLLRWASIEVQENGVANVGCPCKVRGRGLGRRRAAAATAAARCRLTLCSLAAPPR